MTTAVEPQSGDFSSALIVLTMNCCSSSGSEYAPCPSWKPGAFRKLPAGSVLTAPGYPDGHGADSDPLDEQEFIVKEINALQKTPDWKSTAVIVSYDDSDGWYDHAYSGVTNPSASAADALTGTGACGTGTPLAGQNGRCGYGPRLPLLVISPWAKRNFVSNTLTSQTSIIKFVEDNWFLPRISGSFDSVTGSLARMFDFGDHGFGDAPNEARFILNPVTGQPAATW